MKNQPYIQFGKITVVQGRPNSGKTATVLAVAAALTKSEGVPEPVNVIYQTSELGLADTIKPHLEKLGADCSRVHIVDESGKPPKFSGERIEQVIIEKGAKLFIIDPLYIAHNAQQMKHLEGVAERTGCAIVIVVNSKKRL